LFFVPTVFSLLHAGRRRSPNGTELEPIPMPEH
jgi:hypothetical protein